MESNPGLVVLAVGGIIAFIVVIGVLNSVLKRGLGKLFDFGVKTVNAKKNAEIDQVVAVPLVMTSSATRDEIVVALDTILAPKKAVPWLGAVLFETDRTADKITYALGNKLYPQGLVFEVRFGERDGKTQVVYKCLNLTERNGTRMFADPMMRLRDVVRYAVEGAGDPDKIAEGVKLYGPPEPGSPAALRLRNAKVMTWTGLAVFFFALFRLGQGVYTSELPLWLFVLALGGGCMFLATKMADTKGVRRTVAGPDPDEDETATLPATAEKAGAPTDHSFESRAAQSSPGVEHALAAASGAVKAATSRGKSALGWFSSLSGNAKAGVVAGVVVVVFVAGFLFSNVTSNPSSAGSDGRASVNIDNVAGTGGDYTPTANNSSSGGAASQGGASAADSSGQSVVTPPAERKTLQDLLATANEDGSQIELTGYWDNKAIAQTGELVFIPNEGDNPPTFVLGRNDSWSTNIGGASESMSVFISTVGGSNMMFGTVAYTKGGIVYLDVKPEGDI